MTKQQAEKKTVKFETEVSKLLDIVANSLYTEKEIFLRELISNSSDACEKLRYVSQTDSSVEKTKQFEIRVHINEKNKTITIKDNGIGMDEKDMQSNLGTIAKSGTEDFIKKMGDKKGDINQIGKFGVGFYSSFMVSDQVVVRSKKYNSQEGFLWTSDGKGTFSIEKTNYNNNGTEIVLSIKKDESEFLSKYRIEEIIKKYSDFVPFPIFVSSEEDDKEKKDKKEVESQINSAEAIWLKDKSKIKEEDYKNFFNQISNFYDDPLKTIHFKAEGVVNYTALLYLPKSQPQDLYHPDRKNKLKLYVNKVFISDKLESLIPAWLRFIPGVVDTEDLSLNISREILQNNAVINKISNAITKRILKEISELKKKKPDEFLSFWKNFGPVIKEGLYEFNDFHDQIFEFTLFHCSEKNEMISLDEYISDFSNEKKKIYYISGENKENLINSPQMELFKNKNINVLLIIDPVDEFWMPMKMKFKEYEFTSITKGEVDIEEKSDKSEDIKEPKENLDFVAYLKDLLKDKVKDVKVSKRLTTSASCLVADENDMDMHLKKLMAANNQNISDEKRILEININHTLVSKVKSLEKSQKDKFSEILYDHAKLMEGENLDDPKKYTNLIAELVSL
ncbi:MAG: molecular chaperone HtpG [alpha proteobacterium HIMB59]|nr:MAG: molecular chaperone HtpG [alpha proteobacterium HIMB59]|tara:strand:- start:9446 stop:11308 length:1863 start_codon:yes stop_codon:yes gene_type:complete